MSAAYIQTLESKQICGYTAAASWLIVAWEAVITMDAEVEFVWPMPRTAYIKWFYFFGKYFALGLQTAVFGIQVEYFGNHEIPLHYCRVYRLLEMAASTLLMLCFDALLLVRIYALYGWRTWASALATIAVVIEFATTVGSAMSTIPMTIYDSNCAMVEVPRTILVFVVGTFLAQAILLCLAYRRRDQAVRSSSIACVTIRDGFLVFVCIAIFLTVIFISTLHDSLVTTLAIYWIPVVTSVATTRIILNLQSSRNNRLTQQFTTEVWGLYGSADSFLLSDGPFERRAT